MKNATVSGGYIFWVRGMVVVRCCTAPKWRNSSTITSLKKSLSSSVTFLWVFIPWYIYERPKELSWGVDGKCALGCHTPVHFKSGAHFCMAVASQRAPMSDSY